MFVIVHDYKLEGRNFRPEVVLYHFFLKEAFKRVAKKPL
jgi:hypothetical protein